LSGYQKSGTIGEKGLASINQDMAELEKHPLSDMDRKLIGMWKYRTLTSEEAPGVDLAQEGLLGFKVIGGKLTGHSYSTLTFKPSAGAAGALHVVSLEGDAPDRDGRFSFTMAVANGAMRSEATLSKDGKALNGRTFVEGKADGKTVRFSYSWTAHQFTGPE
jgi:hypothetical protein